MHCAQGKGLCCWCNLLREQVTREYNALRPMLLFFYARTKLRYANAMESTLMIMPDFTSPRFSTSLLRRRSKRTLAPDLEATGKIRTCFSASYSFVRISLSMRLKCHLSPQATYAKCQNLLHFCTNLYTATLYVLSIYVLSRSKGYAIP